MTLYAHHAAKRLRLDDPVSGLTAHAATVGPRGPARCSLL